MGKYFNNVPGYYRVEKPFAILPDKYYIITYINLRGPMLLRLACSTRRKARRYIKQYLNPKLHNPIKGKLAIKHNLRFRKASLSIGHIGKPVKYEYPKNIHFSMRSSYRAKYRDQLANYLLNLIRQYGRAEASDIKEFTIRTYNSDNIKLNLNRPSWQKPKVKRQKTILPLPFPKLLKLSQLQKPMPSK